MVCPPVRWMLVSIASQSKMTRDQYYLPELNAIRAIGTPGLSRASRARGSLVIGSLYDVEVRFFARSRMTKS